MTGYDWLWLMVGWSTLFCKYRIFSLNLCGNCGSEHDLVWLVSFDIHHSICNAMLLFLCLVLLHNDIPRPCWIIASSSILHHHHHHHHHHHQFFIIIKTYTHRAITCSHHSHGLIHIPNLHLQQFALVFGIPHRSSSALEKSSSAFSAFFWVRSSSSCTEKKARWKGVTWINDMMLTWCIEIEKNDQRTANNRINDLSKFSNSSTLCGDGHVFFNINHG